MCRSACVRCVFICMRVCARAHMMCVCARALAFVRVFVRACACVFVLANRSFYFVIPWKNNNVPLKSGTYFREYLDVSLQFCHATSKPIPKRAQSVGATSIGATCVGDIPVARQESWSDIHRSDLHSSSIGIASTHVAAMAVALTERPP